MNLLKNEKFLILFLASTVSILLLIKVLLYDDCYAFDSNDDVNHTFVNLKAAQDILKHGEVPEINLYNNFGTPILGDALTFPFSLQSITYWFLPNYLAMTVNRALIAFLTIIFLFLFLRTFLSPLSSMLASLLVFFSPGAFWNFAHHHYQMTLLCFTFILYIQVRLSSLRAGRNNLLLLWTGYVVFFLSVSIQLVVFAIPFLVLFIPVRYGFKLFRTWIINIIILISATILTWPQTYIFFKNIGLSTRANWSPYSGLFTTERQQLLSLLLPPGEWMHFALNGHFTIATYLSSAFLIFVIIGIFSLFKNLKENLPDLRVIIIFGMVPLVAGYLLQYYGQYLPFIKSVDSTRAWWFAILFLAISIGKLVDSSWNKDFYFGFKILIGISSLVLILSSLLIEHLIPEFTGMALVHKLVFLGTGLSLLIIFASSLLAKSSLRAQRSNLLGKYFIITVLILAQIPTIVHVMGLKLKSCHKGNHYFSYKDEATFQPNSLLNNMAPSHRVASFESAAVEGHDLKVIFGGILGSNARAIVSSQMLMNILKTNNLIKIDDNYFFVPPWQTDKLNKLGIRYLLLKQQDSALDNKGWHIIATDTSVGQKYFLYENPSKATPIYILQDGVPMFINAFKLIPNGINVELSKIHNSTLLIAAFFKLDSWSAFVDGKEIKPTMTDLGMMQVPINPGDKSVLFKFQRLKPSLIIFAFLLSVAMLLITLIKPLRTNNA